jgi:glycosyltransferase involved in cell wall biosynthesis
MKYKKIKIYIEASSITDKKPSGIGFSVANTIKATQLLEDFDKKYEIVLMVHKSARKNLNQWNFGQTVQIKNIPLERHILHILLKYNLLPPMDLIMGRGIYIFPNYKNWPLLFSKSATYIYDVAFVLYPETIHPSNLIMLKKNIHKWIERSNRIVTISRTSRREIVSNLNIPPKKIDIIYCGVDSEVYNNKIELPDKIKKKFFIKDKYILFVGNIEPRKNILNLLNAFSGLPDKVFKDFSLLLIGGGGWLNENINSKIQNLQDKGLPVIRPREYIPEKEMPQIYAGATLYVGPSIHEGFDLPSLQAMACGVPLAVSDIPVHREIVGDAGIYFNPNSVTDMRNKILESLTKNHDYNNLKHIAMSKANEYSWKRSAEGLIACIEKMKR